MSQLLVATPEVFAGKASASIYEGGVTSRRHHRLFLDNIRHIIANVTIILT